MKHRFCLTSLATQRGKTLNGNYVRIAFLIAILGVFSVRVRSQELATIDKAYHPGEQVHVMITFAGSVDLSGVGVAFNLDKVDNEAQRLWSRGFNLTELRRLQPNQYEATGAIPEYAASGVYRLIRAWSGVLDLTKGYDYPDTLHQNITIRVLNEKRDPLPAVIDLRIVK
jgi:hypothetical protein